MNRRFNVFRTGLKPMRRVNQPTFAAVPRIKTKVAQKAPRSRGEIDAVIADVRDSLISSINRPIVLCVLSVIIMLIFTSGPNFSSGILAPFIKSSDTAAANWIRNNTNKFTGLLVFTPAVLDLPQSIRMPVAAFVVAWVMVIPEATVYEFFLQAFLLHTFFRVRRVNTKMVTLAFMVLAYYFGYVLIGFSAIVNKPK